MESSTLKEDTFKSEKATLNSNIFTNQSTSIDNQSTIKENTFTNKSPNLTNNYFINDNTSIENPSNDNPSTDNISIENPSNDNPSNDNISNNITTFWPLDTLSSNQITKFLYKILPTLTEHELNLLPTILNLPPYQLITKLSIIYLKKMNLITPFTKIHDICNLLIGLDKKLVFDSFFSLQGSKFDFCALEFWRCEIGDVLGVVHNSDRLNDCMNNIDIYNESMCNESMYNNRIGLNDCMYNGMDNCNMDNEIMYIDKDNSIDNDRMDMDNEKCINYKDNNRLYNCNKNNTLKKHLSRFNLLKEREFYETKNYCECCISRDMRNKFEICTGKRKNMFENNSSCDFSKSKRIKRSESIVDLNKIGSRSIVDLNGSGSRSIVDLNRSESNVDKSGSRCIVDLNRSIDRFNGNIINRNDNTINSRENRLEDISTNKLKGTTINKLKGTTTNKSKNQKTNNTNSKNQNTTSKNQNTTQSTLSKKNLQLEAFKAFYSKFNLDWVLQRLVDIFNDDIFLKDIAFNKYKYIKTYYQDEDNKFVEECESGVGYFKKEFFVFILCEMGLIEESKK
ncbi:hypothetical protein NAPIS_ORF02765 [Vairimorpha apis BRL 01]|uniref:Uncharacterized protein n=1 Tax=Vairimorpha apis BRL 01 TaxID=1037528 RepID=T0L579_9MICR|nr:hypothetical protein NAPIS_ORF02765 [Vairimorpha apis BRL 01]